MSDDAARRNDAERELAPWRARWSLTADGDPFLTPSSALQPVRREGRAAFLKRALVDEESAGARVQRWWAGDGAAEVFAFGDDGDALLLERAEGSRSLAALARSGPDGDDEATRILCRAGLRLHDAGAGPRPDGLFSLDTWFRELFENAEDRPEDHDGLFPAAASAAAGLLARPGADVVLHGDLHHGNVLDFSERGWLAIDPKPVHGDPGFDWVNILCNPGADVALRAGRLERTAGVIAAEVGIDEGLLLRWAFAWTGLSAAWSERSDEEAEVAVAVGRRARSLLGG